MEINKWLMPSRSQGCQVGYVSWINRQPRVQSFVLDPYLLSQPLCVTLVTYMWQILKHTSSGFLCTKHYIIYSTLCKHQCFGWLQHFTPPMKFKLNLIGVIRMIMWIHYSIKQGCGPSVFVVITKFCKKPPQVQTKKYFYIASFL